VGVVGGFGGVGVAAASATPYPLPAFLAAGVAITYGALSPKLLARGVNSRSMKRFLRSRPDRFMDLGPILAVYRDRAAYDVSVVKSLGGVQEPEGPAECV
jgi:hypothetical protein